MGFISSGIRAAERLNSKTAQITKKLYKAEDIALGAPSKTISRGLDLAFGADRRTVGQAVGGFAKGAFTREAENATLLNGFTGRELNGAAKLGLSAGALAAGGFAASLSLKSANAGEYRGLGITQGQRDRWNGQTVYQGDLPAATYGKPEPYDLGATGDLALALHNNRHGGA